MPAKAITFSRWKFIAAASLMGLSAALALQAQAQPSGAQDSPVSTAPAYGGAATEGGPGSLNAATGKRVPESPVPLSSGASSAAQGNSSSQPASQQALQPSAQQPALSNADRNLMRTLAQTHLAEIDMAKMAQSRSQDVTVRSFAQRMIDDHGKALEELKKLADARDVILPGGPDKKHVAIKEKLTAMTGEEFTQNYLTHAGENAHREAHQLLQQAAQNAQDPVLKEQVGKSLAIVEQHLQMAGHLIAKTRGRSALQSSGASSGQPQDAAAAAQPPRGGIPAAPGSAPR